MRIKRGKKKSNPCIRFEEKEKKNCLISHLQRRIVFMHGNDTLWRNGNLERLFVFIGLFIDLLRLEWSTTILFHSVLLQWKWKLNLPHSLIKVQFWIYAWQKARNSQGTEKSSSLGPPTPSSSSLLCLFPPLVPSPANTLWFRAAKNSDINIGPHAHRFA